MGISFNSTRIHKDFGFQKLPPDWRALFDKAGLRKDLFAGFTVACVAVPLSLAIALASGVDPAVGLVSAIVAGIVCGPTFAALAKAGPV